MKKAGSHTDFSFSFSSLPYRPGRGASHGPGGLMPEMTAMKAGTIMSMT